MPSQSALLFNHLVALILSCLWASCYQLVLDSWRVHCARLSFTQVNWSEPSLCPHDSVYAHIHIHTRCPPCPLFFFMEVSAFVSVQKACRTKTKFIGLCMKLERDEMRMFSITKRNLSAKLICLLGCLLTRWPKAKYLALKSTTSWVRHWKPLGLCCLFHYYVSN